MPEIITLYDLNDVNPVARKVMHGVEVDGWYPVDIEYSYNLQTTIVYLVWKIVGTNHVFTIQADIVDKIHGENVKEHFIKTLERFLEHYHNWKKYGYADDWKEKYKKEFGDRIKS